MKRAHGIDISKYQVSFNASAKPDDIDFIIMRTSYGLKRDEEYDGLLEDIQTIPIRGAYHYFSSAVPWKDQANHFLALVDGQGFHFYALDFEKIYNNASAEFARGASKWLRYVKEKTAKVLLYTNLDTYKTWLQPYGNWMPEYPLWIAQYYFEPHRDKNPILPEGVTQWQFWQYWADDPPNHQGAEYGVQSDNIDLDVFNGTVEELRTWLGLTDKPEEIPSIEIPTDGINYDLLAAKVAPLVAPLVVDKLASLNLDAGSVSFGLKAIEPVGPRVYKVKGIGLEYTTILAATGITEAAQLARMKPDQLGGLLQIEEDRAKNLINEAKTLLAT